MTCDFTALLTMARFQRLQLLGPTGWPIMPNGGSGITFISQLHVEIKLPMSTVACNTHFIWGPIGAHPIAADFRMGSWPREPRRTASDHTNAINRYQKHFCNS